MAANSRDDTDRPGRRRSAEDETLSAREIAAKALGHVGELITSTPVGVVSVEPVEDGWLVEVEVLEERRIPSSSDLLALYEVELDFDGGLLAYRRTNRYPRGRAGTGNGAS
ncbi:gas vesicle protein [Amycolatopsis sp. K13G38]|uniref:Gas vesicle protein n=1 Tax=Amycolatopsis acididurans TaxID=2724524 RepID=A0ABX1J1I3_9PSEU|nr:gas vesicle protein [Amycolatopsis acididurans]NKQ52839.1 gas vesicle protein [Amycolatopsis acididurans]